MQVQTFSQATYYRHSGEYSAGGALRAGLLALMVGVPAACAYAILIHWNTFLYINMATAFGFGALVGYCSERFLASRQCRNPGVAGLTALLVMLLCYGVSWLVWLTLVMNSGGPLQYLSPAAIAAALQKISAQGTWSFKGDAITGPVLWIAWALEAVVLFATAIYVAVHRMLEATFCEQCGQPAVENKGALYAGAGTAPDSADTSAIKIYFDNLKSHAAELKRQLEAKNFAWLGQLGAVAEDAAAWYRADLRSCEKCGMTNTLRILQFRKNRRNGKMIDSDHDKEVLRQLILSPAETGALRTMGDAMPPLKRKLALQRAGYATKKAS